MNMRSGEVGLAIVNSISLIGTCQWGMRQITELENQMVSVERVLEYAELPSEPPLESDPKNVPSSDWPRHGNIEFKSLSLQYAENTSRILRNLTFRINAKVSFNISTCSLNSENILYLQGKNRCCWPHWSWQIIHNPVIIPFGTK